MNFCKKTGVRLLGVVENMGGFLGLDSSKVKQMCEKYEVNYLGRIPFTEEIGLAGDGGREV